MNIVELAFGILLLVALVAISKMISTATGIHFFAILPLLATMLVLLLWYAKRVNSTNIYPQCANGECGPGDYRGVEINDNGLVLTCSCGDKYVLKKDRFQRLDSHGNLMPYKRKKLLQGWVAGSY